MKIKKRITLLSLILALFISINSGYSFAYAADVGGSYYSSQANLSAEEQQIYDTIYNGLKNRQGDITLSGYNFSESSFNDVIFPIFSKIKFEKPELFYVGNTLNASGTFNNLKVTPEYTMTTSQINAAKPVYNNGVAQIISGVKSSWGDLEKVVYVNDYIVLNFEYDTSLQNFDAHTMFVTGKGVCQAYHALFVAAMYELNIPVSYVSSDGINHLWSLVKIDGNWYQIDVTHNDPTTDKKGFAFHTNLLKSKEKMKSIKSSISGYTDDWVFEYNSNSTKFDNYEWDSIRSRFVYLDGQWYAINFDTGYIVRFDMQTGKQSNIYSIGNKWTTGQGSSYKGAYSSLETDGTYLYYNTATGIYRYNIASGEAVSVAQKGNQSGFIYGFKLKGNQLTYYLAANPNVTSVPKTITLVQPTLYTATFKSDGVTISQTQYEAGKTISLPNPPTKQGYIFKGWSPVPSTMPANNITFTAQFEKVAPTLYTATFKSDGVTISQTQYEVGEAINLPNPPTKQDYIFKGWSPAPSTMPANNIIFTAQFEMKTSESEDNSSGGSESSEPDLSDVSDTSDNSDTSDTSDANSIGNSNINESEGIESSNSDTTTEESEESIEISPAPEGSDSKGPNVDIKDKDDKNNLGTILAIGIAVLATVGIVIVMIVKRRRK